jgi:hypothetical protein
MAGHPVRKPNRTLPHADIYLDDLREIEGIFCAAHKEAGRTTEFHFEYEIDDETIFDSVDDLQQHGGHSSRVKMNGYETDSLFKSRDSILWFYASLNPTLDFPYWLEESKRWELKARVENIFEGRKNHLKIIAGSIPFWGVATILGVVEITALIVKHHILPLLSLVIVAALLAAFDLRKNRVNFFHQRARTLERQKERQQFWRDARIAIIGSFVGGALVLLTQLAIEHFKH